MSNWKLYRIQKSLEFPMFIRTLVLVYWPYLGQLYSYWRRVNSLLSPINCCQACLLMPSNQYSQLGYRPWFHRHQYHHLTHLNSSRSLYFFINLVVDLGQQSCSHRHFPSCCNHWNRHILLQMILCHWITFSHQDQWVCFFSFYVFFTLVPIIIVWEL